MLIQAAVVCLASLWFTPEVDSKYTVVVDPPGYGTYSCPVGYFRRDLSYVNRHFWTFMQFGSVDSPNCGITNTTYKCTKGRKNKNYMTYKFGYGEYHIGKFTHLSSFTTETEWTGSPGYSSSSDSSSPTLIPIYFAVRALYFRIRGVRSLEIDFQGDISTLISISEAAIDHRKRTWICIEWDNLPIYRNIQITLHFGFKEQAKLWDVYMFSCCEILSTTIDIGKK